MALMKKNNIFIENIISCEGDRGKHGYSKGYPMIPWPRPCYLISLVLDGASRFVPRYKLNNGEMINDLD